jgi:RHS repeat-associated protein
VADSTGTTVWRWDQLEPFGNNVPDENPSGLGVFDLPLRLPGQYFDKETNLHYNYSRYYDQSTGTYEESDPIGLLGGVNTYTYVAGSPLHASDELGLFYGEEAAYAIRAPVAGPAATVAGSFLGGVAIGTAIYNAYRQQIQDALEKICRPDKSPDHRGRIQAQGNTTGPDVNVSSAWAQKQPLTKAEGFAHLHQTVIQIPPRQLPRFTNAIGKAASFIQSTSTQTAPFDKSFYQNWRQSGRRGAERIDIQIFNGEAF